MFSFSWQAVFKYLRQLFSKAINFCVETLVRTFHRHAKVIIVNTDLVISLKKGINMPYNIGIIEVSFIIAIEK